MSKKSYKVDNDSMVKSEHILHRLKCFICVVRNDVIDFILTVFGISNNVMKTQNTFIITIFPKFIKL